MNTIKELLSNITSNSRNNRSDSPNMQPLSRPRIPLPTGSQSPLYRLPLPHSMKNESVYNLTRCNLIKKGIVKPNLVKSIRDIQELPSIYDHVIAGKVLNRSDKLCISPERGLQRAIRTDSARIRSLSFGRSEENRAPQANTSSIQSPRLVHSPSRSLDIQDSVQPMIKTLGCMIMVSAIKLNLDPGVLMTSIKNVLANLPFDSMKDAINSGLFDVQGSGAETLSNIMEVSSSSSMQGSARSTTIQPIPIDLASSSNVPDDPNESTSVDIKNSPNIFKFLIGASLLMVTMAAAAKSLS